LREGQALKPAVIITALPHLRQGFESPKQIQLSIFSPRRKSIETCFFLNEAGNYNIDHDEKII
jgi:hypothetical protein